MVAEEVELEPTAEGSAVVSPSDSPDPEEKSAGEALEVALALEAQTSEAAETVAEVAEAEEATEQAEIALEDQVVEAVAAEAEATEIQAEAEEATEQAEIALEDQVVEALAAEAEATEIQAEAEEATEQAEIALEDQVVEAVAAEVEVAEVQAEAEETAGQVDISLEEAVEQDEAEVPEPEDDRAWYVIHCYSGYESKVKHNLEQRIETMQMQDQIFQVVVPTEDEIEVRDGKRRVVERRVFPGYILVQMILNDDSWYVVRNTPGVTGFVGMGNEPTPLRPEEVQGIMKRMEAEAPKIKVTFKQGQKVRIIDGPFHEFIGMVDEIDMERAKVRVLVSFFGRETPVELDFLQVEKT
jgi:transcriptional antiterminator NusG